jgi:hypothetical protein
MTSTLPVNQTSTKQLNQPVNKADQLQEVENSIKKAMAYLDKLKSDIMEMQKLLARLKVNSLLDYEDSISAIDKYLKSLKE